MKKSKKTLGMDKPISRRDFVNGVGVTLGAALLPGASVKAESLIDTMGAYYPPSATGMRGAHPGSFEAAHAAVRGVQRNGQATGEYYDLVVVGAGISGLAAAHIHRRDVDSRARILILDNHDDFGGHAKRNELVSDDRTFIGFGGTMLIEAPNTYPEVAKQVFRDLGIEASRYGDFNHEEHYRSLGIGLTSFFDKETFGADYLAKGSIGLTVDLTLAPLSADAKAELERLFRDEDDYLEGMSVEERKAVLDSHSWREYLKAYGSFGAEALTYVQKWPNGVWAIGADALPAWMALSEGYPGFASKKSEDEHSDTAAANDDDDHEMFHFPDGNATIARLLVRSLVPGVAPGHSMEDVVMAHFDYSKLDLPANTVRVRLKSTVVNLHHRDGNLEGKVDITYVSDDVARTVSANQVIWAGYHDMLPYVCPDVPQAQMAAQANSVRAPLVYTTVLIKNWQSFAKLGIRRAYCPGSFFQTVMLTWPVSIGGYTFPKSPDEPMVLHLQHIPLAPGLPAADQFRAGRRQLLDTPFATFEHHVRDQLGRMLGSAGFDPARDIEAITVNRWPHGYAYSMDKQSGDIAWQPSRWQHEERPWVTARQRVGNIAFAGTDAASNAMSEAAIEEAHRAVHSLLNEDGPANSETEAPAA